MYMSADQDLAFVVRAVRVAVYLHDSILTAEFMNRAMEVLGPSLDAYGMVTSLSGLPQSFKVDFANRSICHLRKIAMIRDERLKTAFPPVPHNCLSHRISAQVVTGHTVGSLREKRAMLYSAGSCPCVEYLRTALDVVIKETEALVSIPPSFS